MADQVFVGGAVVFEDETSSAVIEVKNGKITKIHKNTTDVSGYPKDIVTDCGGLVLMPGVVDAHVHVNEPGRTDWEGFSSATRSAAAGGVTTIIDMPLNSIPPTTSQEHWEIKQTAAKPQCWVDVGFWGGVIPGNDNCLQEMVRRGICGFKCFLIHSGVDEFPAVNYEDVEKALQALQGTNSVLLFHAECDIGTTVTESDPAEKYSTFLASRPDRMEELAIEQVIRLSEKYKVRCHIVHLSTAKALPMIRSAQARGVPLSVETCHHYLTLSAETIPDYATEYKCCPPVRGQANQEDLWKAVKDGTICQVVSDHSPCTPNLKMPGEMDFMAAWGGISSLQFGLSLFWTGASQRGLTLQDVVKLMCSGPASQASISHCKGAIAEGKDADFVLWDPHAMFKVEKDMIEHKNKLTPYIGRSLYGRVYKTVVRGKTVYEDGKFMTGKPQGQFVFTNSPVSFAKL
ncbi:allantoinase [Oratosquilla oratoria]|uniref:allantoinase n=1 Tax=Oratosquilla oratoria TaxID=337810 RepID=UPI003F76338C